MNELWKSLTDPRVSIVGVLVGAVTAGFGILWVGYRTIAQTALVPRQMPLLVSTGAVALALVGAALALLSTHVSRVEAAEERRQLAELHEEALELLLGDSI
jgi:hypothetical protein